MVKRRLAAIVLAMALFGANTAMASVCELYCAGVSKESSDHHHPTARPPSNHHHMLAQQYGRDCPECPKSVTQYSRPLPDCGTLTEAQALPANSRVLSHDRAIFQPGVTKSSTGLFLAPLERDRFSSPHSPPDISSFQPVLVSLR